MNKAIIQGQLNQIKNSVDVIQAELMEVPVITFPVPVLDGNVLKSSSSNALFEPYTPVFFIGGKWWFYYYGWNSHLLCRSISGLDLQSVDVIRTVGMHYGAISEMFKGKIYHSWHEWINGRCLNHFASSTDGVNFTEYTVREIWSGEDRSFLVDGDFLVCYIRPNPPSQGRRSIGHMHSTNGVDWSDIKKVLDIPFSDYENPNHKDFKKELYSMSVCKISNTEYWGIVNVFDISKDTVHTELVHSTNGMNFTRFNEQPFIPIPGGVKQQYATVNYVNGKIVILVQSSRALHGVPTDENTRFELSRYSIDPAELRKLLQS